jgi:hypothetical protein
MTLIVSQIANADGSPSDEFRVLAVRDGLEDWGATVSSYRVALLLACEYLAGLVVEQVPEPERVTTGISALGIQ